MDDPSELLDQPLILWSIIIGILFIILMRFRAKLKNVDLKTTRVLAIIMPLLIVSWLIYAIINAIIT